ncbi:50S ribosomal protein L44e [Candidatus Bathyarchaeota archaeon]|nr:50S ribosomal protein L44e [Candidatus Bathyarchaeota archaeon]
MKVPRNIRTYCPKCRQHRSHAVSLYKKGRDRKMAEGNRRSVIRKRKGYGGQRDPRQRKFSKTSKKQVLLLKCSTCGHTVERLGIRLRKIEIVT